MSVASENYRGIEFIRISSLPDSMRNAFCQSFDKDKIIKILTGNSLLHDCILYTDYVEWSKKSLEPETVNNEPALVPKLSVSLKMA
jgi:hypothetical protein